MCSITHRHHVTQLHVAVLSRKFIPFPDNQVVLDLIDKPQTGILQLLDEQCMVNWGTDDKFSSNLYSKCEKHDRFSVGSAQRVRKQFSVEHYAGYVEYTVENWLEKNKDQLPAASVELLESSEFELISQIKVKFALCFVSYISLASPNILI